VVSAVQSKSTVLVSVAPFRIAAYRKPGSVDFTLMEQRLREYLDGKFFNVEGDDEAEIDAQLKAEDDARYAAAAEAKRIQKLRVQEKIEFDKRKREQLRAMRGSISRFTSPMIVEAVCYAHCVSGGALMSVSRRRNVVHARQHAIWLMLKLTKKSRVQVGIIFGRDHSTVIHSCKEWEKNRQRYAKEVAVVSDVLGIDA
jgi:hypothetical protein